MLCPELPSGSLWTGTEDANSIAPECRIVLSIALQARSPLLAVQFGPTGPVAGWFLAAAPQSSLRTSGSGNRLVKRAYPGSRPGRQLPRCHWSSLKSGRGPIRVETIIVEDVRVHEAEDVLCGHLVPTHRLRRMRRAACDRFAHRLLGYDQRPEASRERDYIPGRLHQLQRQAGDPAQLVDRAATSHRQQRPRIVPIDFGESGGRLDLNPSELCRRCAIT